MEFGYRTLSQLGIYLTNIWRIIFALKTGQKAPEVRSQEEISYIRHRTSRSPIRRHLRPSSLNPLSPLDPEQIATTPSPSASHHSIPRLVRVSSTRRKKTLILDLDETLVHASPHSILECELITEVFIEGRSSLYYVRKRPHLDAFLDRVANWFHLAIYTASIREYAFSVVSWLDQGRNLFEKRLFRSVTN